MTRYDSGLLAHKSEAVGPLTEHPSRTRIFCQQDIPDPSPSRKSKPRPEAKSQVIRLMLRNSVRHSHARYDAAGNRTDSVTDNLNRTTSIGGVATTCDKLGNRLTRGSTTSYTWDVLNRMKQLANATSTTNYEYRADGMRSHKSNPAGTVFTEYYHDGQMPMEDAVINGSGLTVTRYGLGARGIDYEEEGTGTWTSSTSRSPGAFSNVGFPIYDAHGNMIATLARYGSNSFQLNNKRSYDAWGSVRVGASTGDPKNRYCGSLGHQQDDESGLVYMRARYYEPGSGRFVVADPELSGNNFFSYCCNNPIGFMDPSGNTKVDPEHRDLFDFYYTMFKVFCFLSAISACAHNLSAVIFCLSAATLLGMMCLGETNFDHGLIGLMQVPAFMGLAVAWADTEEVLSKNAVTCIVAGLTTLSFTMDVAALMTIDG